MIYLDSAATTLQKPPAVPQAVAKAMQTMASPGRGGHRPAMLAAEITFACREMAALYFGVDDPERVIFTSNATHALNIAIHSVVKPGNRVLTSGFEHNAVARPLQSIEGISLCTAASPLFCPEQFLQSASDELSRGVDAVVCTHVSNVFGYIIPMEELAALCRKHGVPLIVDASQSAGCLPVTLERWGAAYIAMPGHKSLYGPQGTGLLLCGKGQTPQPLLRGGTGSNSDMRDMPDFLPDRLEAGTHNVAGIAGLLEGLRFVARGRDIMAHERRLVMRMAAGLRMVPGVEVFVAHDMAAQAGVLSFRIDGMDCEQVAEQLGAWGTCVRAGLHCAPAAHRTAGTADTGTVRASVSAFNTAYEADRLVTQTAQMAKQRTRLTGTKETQSNR